MFFFSSKIKSVNLNKRALGPWVAHLKMIVYKGKGKHSSSQSLAMNLDRLAVSYGLKIGYADKIVRLSKLNK